MKPSSIDSSRTQLSAEPSVDVVGARAAAQAQNTRCRHQVFKHDVCLRNSRRELVAACKATSTTGLILFREFVGALRGLDPCRNGRKRCRKHGYMATNTHRQDTQTRHKQHQHFFLAPRSRFFFTGITLTFHDPLIYPTFLHSV